MKISRIDVQARLGDDGEHYDGLGREWLIQSGLLPASGADEDRGTEARLSDPAQAQGHDRAGTAGEGARTDGSCSRDCATCGCRVAEGEGGR